MVKVQKVNDLIVVMGEKTFKVLTLTMEPALGLTEIYDHSSKSVDKLIYIEWRPTGFTCLYAHNWVEKFKASEGSQEKCEFVLRQFCEEECILYAGDIKAVDEQRQVVVAGTVFRSILIWEVNNREADGLERDTAVVIHRLEGHTGVIFDVRFLRQSEDIVSVSDDRSIRVWTPHEGGYSQSHEFYGHRSRVWAVRETKDMLASVSEDATCKLWRVGHETSGKPFETLKGHSGKNVRAIATVSDEQSDLMATGGEDGAIKVYDIT